MRITRLDERKTAGRFQTGNPGGPGRPPRQTEQGYLAVLMEACSLEDWRGVVAAAVRDAQDGNGKAREWLARYLVGEPEHQAPAPMKVVIQQLIGRDEALEKAAAILAQPDLDALLCGGDIEAARAEILAAEAQRLERAEAAQAGGT